MAAGKKRWRHFMEWLHLWVGLVSSVPVFIVCLTGCLWVFRDEVTAITQAELTVEAEQLPYLPPSHFREGGLSLLAEQHHRTFTIDKVTYLARNKAVVVTCFGEDDDEPAFVAFNPYSGALIAHWQGYTATERFFAFIIYGHRYLWLPPNIGKLVVGWSCILFLVVLVSGLVWWYPRKWNKSTRQKSFRVKWRARWKRLTIDLHNVLGFYALSLLIVLTATGLVYSFLWFEKGYFSLLTAGERLPDKAYPMRAAIGQPVAPDADDELWHRSAVYAGSTQTIILLYPIAASDTYAFIVNPSTTTRHRQYYRFFDPVSLKELTYSHPSGTPFGNLSGRGERFFKRNYDIHVGAIGGLPTKIVAFLASLVGASLPITGFLVWYNRKWRKKRPSFLTNESE